MLGREKILQVHMKKVRVGPDVDPRVIARGTPGFSGADLANIVNEAALLAARAGKRMVAMVDFESAKDKVMMGAERRSMVMTEEEKRLTAYHEAGHALVGYSSPASDPIHKATIIPRGRALGMVMRLPEGDRISVSREKLNADIAVAMGGRVAEELIFGHDKVTAGAASDIEQATKIARHMVTQWGMSDKLGPMAYGENQQEVFLGHSITQSQNVSEATARLIDAEIRRIVDEGYAGAQHDHLEQSERAARPRQCAARARDADRRGGRRGAARRPDAEGAAAGAAERERRHQRPARLGADHRAAQGRCRRHGAQPATGRVILGSAAGR